MEREEFVKAARRMNEGPVGNGVNTGQAARDWMAAQAGG